MGSGGVGPTDRPAGTMGSIRDYYAGRGYSENPPLEFKEERQVSSYEKPLPDGRRVHVRVFRGKKTYTLDEHVDPHDPNRDPLGHVQDIVFPAEHTRMRIKRKDAN